MTKEFADLQSIDIKFIEVNPAGADDFGFRITLNETVKNTSQNINWKGFVLELIDPNPILEPGDPNGNILGKNDNVVAKHPGFAHFHKDANQTFTPFTPTPNPPVQGDLQGKEIALKDGAFNAGTMRDWKGIGIHQIEEKDQQRNFILRETPSTAAIPEPSTLAFFSMGILSPLAYGWRRRIRKDQV